MKAKYVAIPLLTILLLGGCQSVPENQQDSQYAGIPKGSEIVLHEMHALTGGNEKIVIRQGKFQKRQKAHGSYCYFVIRIEDFNAVRSSRLRPDTFRVTKTKHEKNVAGAYPLELANVAGNTYYLDWVMHLRSDRQPFVKELVCGIHQEGYEKDYLTINQIRTILGEVATVKTN